MDKREILKYALLFIPLLALDERAFAEYIRATNEEEIILVSTDQEVRMGKSLIKDVVKEFGLDEDNIIQNRIDTIGQNIAAVCDRKDISYHFNVLKGEKLKPEERLNAFAIPGGYIFIFRDMVNLMETDDEIAGILAHEVGHVAAKHSIKKIQGSLGAMALNLAGARMARDPETRMRINAAIGLLMMSYSREDESTADRLSVRYLKKAGYNPEAILSSIDKMMEEYRKMPIRDYTPYQSHPYMAERKAIVKKEIYGSMDFVDFINEPQP